MTTGQTVRNFHFHTCLGKGGFGDVYRVTMTSPGGLSRDVAIKMLRDNIAPESQPVRRLYDEGRLLARLDHPVILGVVDFVVIGDRVGLITEYIEGQDLGYCLKAPDAMPIKVLLEVIASVSSALHAAWHTPAASGKPLQLVHRDIKPSNIRISKYGGVKLLDFGIARSNTMTREAMTQTDAFMGSWMYMAPERFIESDPGPSCDVYSLGAVLYEGVAGIPLCEGINPMVLAGMAAWNDRYAQWLDSRLQARPLPSQIKRLLRTCLASNPKDRPTADALTHHCEDLAVSLRGPSLRRWCSERTWPKASAMAADLVGRVLSETTLLDGVLATGLKDAQPPSEDSGGPSNGQGLAPSAKERSTDETPSHRSLGQGFAAYLSEEGADEMPVPAPATTDDSVSDGGSTQHTRASPQASADHLSASYLVSTPQGDLPQGQLIMQPLEATPEGTPTKNPPSGRTFGLSGWMLLLIALVEIAVAGGLVLWLQPGTLGGNGQETGQPTVSQETDSDEDDTETDTANPPPDDSKQDKKKSYTRKRPKPKPRVNPLISKPIERIPTVANPAPRLGVIHREDSRVPMQLRHQGLRVGFGEVSPGTYEVWADFGQGFKPSITVFVRADQTIIVSCNPLLYRCTED